MENYKEIVTKAIIDKNSKNISLDYTLPISNIDNVLGCWVINHRFGGNLNNNKVVINGEYDINVWYSFDNNSKTNVIIKKFNYSVEMDVNNNSIDTELMVKCLSQPNVIDASVDGDNIKLKVESTMGVELIGNTTVKINVINDVNNMGDFVNYPEINTNYLK